MAVGRVECPLCGKEVAATVFQPGKSTRTPLEHPVYARHRRPKSKLFDCLASRIVVGPAEQVAQTMDECVRIAISNASWMRERTKTDGYDPGLVYEDRAKDWREAAEMVRMRARAKGLM